MWYFFPKKNLIVDNRKLHDPQRPHLDKGYNIEEYKKLTMDMVGKVKDLKTVAGSPSVKSITSQLLFRYGITMSWNCQCFGVVCYVLHCLRIIHLFIHALFWIKHRIWWNCFIMWMVYCGCALQLDMGGHFTIYIVTCNHTLYRHVGSYSISTILTLLIWWIHLGPWKKTNKSYVKSLLKCKH